MINILNNLQMGLLQQIYHKLTNDMDLLLNLYSIILTTINSINEQQELKLIACSYPKNKL